MYGTDAPPTYEESFYNSPRAQSQFSGVSFLSGLGLGGLTGYLYSRNQNRFVNLCGKLETQLSFDVCRHSFYIKFALSLITLILVRTVFYEVEDRMVPGVLGPVAMRMIRQDLQVEQRQVDISLC